MPDIKVVLSNKYEVRFKHQLEKELDKVMVTLGFARTGGAVNADGSMEIDYRQFGVCGVTTEEGK